MSGAPPPGPTTGDYQFQAHERPLMPGSPATPTHPMPRRVAYAAIGALVALTSGLSNGLLLANLAQIQGALGITSVEGGWLTAAYSMTNVCAGFVLIKARQQLGLERIIRVALLAFVAVCGAQVVAQGYVMEVAIRAVGGAAASAMTPLGFFYIVQALPPTSRMAGMIIGLGLSQAALPLARALSPLLLANGDIENLYLFEFGLALACLGAMSLLRLPPSERAEVVERLDFVTFALLAPGLALLTAVLVQGRIVWWTTPWIGYSLAAAIVLIGAALLIEHNRANPLLNTRWMGSVAILRFAGVAATMRVLLGEQNYGSLGLLATVGMVPDQLRTLYAIVTLATLAGLALSVATLNPNDLLRPVVVSVLVIFVAALLDSQATNLVRPGNVYVTQAMLGFAAVYFLGPTMMAGVVRAISRGPSHMVSFSAVFGIAQTIGGLGGSALLGTFQILREKYHSHELAQAMTLSDPQVADRLRQLGGAYGRVLGDPVLRQAEAAGLLAQQVTREANILAFNDVFLLLAGLAALALLGLGGWWISLRRRGVNPLADDLAALQRLRAERT